MKNTPKKNNKAIKLSLALSLSVLAFSASAQHEAEVLKRAGLNVVNGFGIPGSPERVNTIRGNNYDDVETRPSGQVPSDTRIQGGEGGMQEDAVAPAEHFSQHNKLNNQLSTLSEKVQKSLDDLAEQNGVPTSSNSNQVIPTSAAGTEGKKKKVINTARKQVGPRVEQVDITHFNQETIKEMQAYGQNKQQEEYLKFRIQASQHKNPPIQIRKP